MASIQRVKKIFSPFWIGVAAFILLISLFFILLTFLNSFEAAAERFLFRWYFYLPITVGFGLQVGLFSFMRKSLKENNAPASALVATGSVSSGTMALCCTHYIANLIPIMAVSGVSIFFTKYEVPFLVMGVFSNVIGISFMLYYIQNYNVPVRNKVLGKIMSLNMLKVRKVAILLSVIIVAVYFIYYSMIF